MARQLRRQATPAERCLWDALRKRRVGWRKWRRQHLIAGYIVDFYCTEVRIAIEVDGEVHRGREDEDARRTEHLAAVGVRVVRFTNDDVLYDLERVLEAISEIVEPPSPALPARPPSPALPPR